jgi:hypothetical protein
MRMWMFDPALMCKKHITGEHGEIHKHKHNFEKKHSITGRIKPVVQIEPESMKSRHDELSKYMNHTSDYEMPDLSYLPDNERFAKVNINKSKLDLIDRCEDCKNLIVRDIVKKYLF